MTTKKEPYEGDWIVHEAQQGGRTIPLPDKNKRVSWNIERHTSATTLQFTVKMAANTFQVQAVTLPSDPDFPRLTRFRMGHLVNFDHKTVHPAWQEYEGMLRASLDGRLHLMELKDTTTPTGTVQELWLQGPNIKIVLRR